MSCLSNHTESCPKIFAKRAAYVAAHLLYLGYVRQLLDTATLPSSEVGSPNLTTMASMLAELRARCSGAHCPNSVVLGRVLHRVLPGLLTWHGGRHIVLHPGNVPIICETTVYRFAAVQRCRNAFAKFVAIPDSWPNDFDQWQSANRGGEL